MEKKEIFYDLKLNHIQSAQLIEIIDLSLRSGGIKYLKTGSYIMEEIQKQLPKEDPEEKK